MNIDEYYALPFDQRLTESIAWIKAQKPIEIKSLRHAAGRCLPMFEEVVDRAHRGCDIGTFFRDIAAGNIPGPDSEKVQDFYVILTHYDTFNQASYQTMYSNDPKIRAIIKESFPGEWA